MIGGIFETIGKTLGVGKEKYFLELDDAAESVAKNVGKSAKSAAKTAKKASAEVVDKAQELASDATATAKEVASDAKDTADKAKAAAKKAKKAAPDKKTAKKGKAAKGKAANATPAAEPEAPAAPAAPAAPDPEELIVNAIAAASSGKKLDSAGNVIDETQTFATDYLETPIRTRRRRPGPSFAGFKGMAKEVNPRLK
ncbi:MAG: hypothetical protein AAFY33_07265 [Cyanobacteria bacterium J06643_4]